MTEDILPRDIDFSEYRGEWVLVCNRKLVAHNRNVNALRTDIHKCRNTPTLVRIPDKEAIIF